MNITIKELIEGLQEGNLKIDDSNLTEKFENLEFTEDEIEKVNYLREEQIEIFEAIFKNIYTGTLLKSFSGLFIDFNKDYDVIDANTSVAYFNKHSKILGNLKKYYALKYSFNYDSNVIDKGTFVHFEKLYKLKYNEKELKEINDFYLNLIGIGLYLIKNNIEANDFFEKIKGLISKHLNLVDEVEKEWLKFHKQPYDVNKFKNFHELLEKMDEKVLLSHLVNTYMINFDDHIKFALKCNKKIAKDKLKGFNNKFNAVMFNSEHVKERNKVIREANLELDFFYILCGMNALNSLGIEVDQKIR